MYAAIYRGRRGLVHSTDIRARSYGEALKAAARRRMGEHVAGLGFYRNRGTAATCSEVLRSRKATPIDRIHALTFLALLATSSRVATARDFLDDDNGLLHAWVHLEMVRENPEGIPPALVRGMRQYVLAVVGEIERAIPGYPVARRRR